MVDVSMLGGDCFLPWLLSLCLVCLVNSDLNLSANRDHMLITTFAEIRALAHFVNDDRKYQDIYAVVKTVNGTFLFVNFMYNTTRVVFGTETIACLKFNSSTLSTVSENLLLHFEVIHEPIPSLVVSKTSPDSIFACSMVRVYAAQPTNFVLSQTRLPDMVNPAIVQYGPKVLVSWYTLDPWDSNASEDTQSPLSFAFLPEGFRLLREINKSSMQSVHYAHPANNSSQTLFSNYPAKADPRMIILPNNSIAVLFTTVRGLSRNRLRFQQAQLVLDVQDSAINVHDNYILMYESKSRHEHNQKNWVPFIHNGTEHLIQSLQSVRVLTLGHSNADHSISTKRVMKTNMTAAHRQDLLLPWLGIFGGVLRGGTPAILVRGVYLSFFHTATYLHEPFPLITYFMGAVTFCPSPPFTIHATSMYPIALPEWYEGKWATKVSNHLAYVVFPTGFILDRQDDRYLYLSMGRQDQDGYIIKLEIDGLLKTLVEVSSC